LSKAPSVEGSGGGDELEHREASGPRAASEREGAMCLEDVLKRQVCTFHVRWDEIIRADFSSYICKRLKTTFSKGMREVYICTEYPVLLLMALDKVFAL
jgi:hypothetical protein